MKFSISSDLHLDMQRFGADNIRTQIVESGADFHLIAGDVYNDIVQLNDFVSRIPNSIAIHGNHEYYKSHEVPNDEFEIRQVGDIKIFAGTLWTDFNREDPLTELAVYNGLNDSFHINGYSIDLIKKINKTHREAIFDLQPDIVMTHHAPSRQSIAERYKNDHHMNGGFVNDYDNYIADSKIKVWCHGHTHTRMDYMIGNTRVICNPLGYRGENATPWYPVVFEL